MKKGPQSAGFASRRQYAKRRGVDEKSIRKAIEAGILTAALRSDGLIDVAAADAALAAAKIGGDRVASNLVKARARKIGAAVALLADEVAELEAGAAPAAEAAGTMRLIALHMARELWPLADLAPRLAGLDRNSAIAVLEAEVRTRLEELASTKVTAPRSKGRKPTDRPALADMSPVDLAAQRATLQARKMEIQRGARVGVLVDVAALQEVAVGRVMRCRARLLAMPSKLGGQIGDTADAAELAPALEAEVREALAELVCASVTITDIQGARSQAVEGAPVFKLHPQGKDRK